MIIWFVILGILVYYFVFGQTNYNLNIKRDSNFTLNERLASGEISIETYRENKYALKEKQ